MVWTDGLSDNYTPFTLLKAAMLHLSTLSLWLAVRATSDL